MPFLPLRALPLGNSRFVVFLVGLLLGALLLNLHLGRSYSVSGSGRRSRSSLELRDRAPEPVYIDPHLQQITCDALPVHPQYKSDDLTYDPMGVYGGRNVTYNPAGVFDNERGWIVLTRVENAIHAPAYPLVLPMGQDRDALNLTLAAERQALWTMDDETLGTKAAKKRQKPWSKAEDFRPFMWKGKVHVAHPLWAGDTNWIWECISTLDFDKQLMKAAYCFDKLPIQGDHKKEKNWAMADINDTLLILHQLAPCLTFLRFEPSAKKGLAMHSMTCYGDLHHRLLEHTGATADGGLHLSGHFVRFPRQLAVADAERRGLNASEVAKNEFFVMAHRRDANVFSHWGFRINADTLKLTHISKGPVLSGHMLPSGLHTFVVVGSYHFVNGGDGLLMFWGHENIRACRSRVDPKLIQWYSLPPGAGKSMSLDEDNGYSLS